MRIVIDSNILFSAFISGKTLYLDIIRENQIYVPDIVFLELAKYETRLIERTVLKEDEFRTFIQMLFEEITVIPGFAISKENWKNAYEICKDVDEKDTPFVALSLELGIPLWTNDKELIKVLKEKGLIELVTLEDLIHN